MAGRCGVGVSKRCLQVMSICRNMSCRNASTSRLALGARQLSASSSSPTQVSIAEEVQMAPVAVDGDPDADRVYEMTGQTGSLCYMAPEVLLGCFYNQKARSWAPFALYTTDDRKLPAIHGDLETLCSPRGWRRSSAVVTGSICQIDDCPLCRRLMSSASAWCSGRSSSTSLRSPPSPSKVHSILANAGLTVRKHTDTDRAQRPGRACVQLLSSGSPLTCA